MSEQATKVFIESEYLDLFKQAVAFYDHSLKAEVLENPHILVARAVEQAQLPVYGDPHNFYEMLMAFHRSNSVFAENILRYVWAEYVTSKK